MDTYLAPTSSVWNHGKNERDLKQFVDEGVAPSPGDEENDDSDEEMANGDDDTAASETSFGFKAHRSAVNAIAVTEKFLITGGDEELRVWSRPWENPDDRPKVTAEFKVPQHRGLRGALSEIAEVNGLAADASSSRIFAAAGDSNAYCWDVETGSVLNTFRGHTWTTCSA